MDNETGLYRTPLSQHDAINHVPHGPAQEQPTRSTSTPRPPVQPHLDPKSHFHHSAELLYDLFFLGNLTTFTSIHTVNDIPTLKSYTSFFSLLWLTWYQISLYDARFSKTSIVERIFKALQLGAMMGFAACGPQFNNNDINNEYGDLIGGDPYRGVSLVLMATRLILVCQYLMTVVFLRKEKASRIPLATLAAIYGFAAIVYFGLFWSFKLDSKIVGNYSWVGFYVIGAFETILVTMLSSLWPVLGPKGGQVIQRMGLLTLVVLGEGAIGVARQCGLIMRSSALSLEGSVIGSIAAAVLALYCAYLIYFDWVKEQFVGSWRQQIWLLLHFPLHLLLALAVEGFTWCITWRAAIVKIRWLESEVEKWGKLFGSGSPEQEASISNGFLDDVQQITFNIVNDTLTTARSPELAMDAQASRNDMLGQVLILRNESSSMDARGEAVLKLLATDLNSIFTIAGFNKDPINMTDNVDVMQQRVKYLIDISFRTTFIYTFVSVGLIIICCTFMAMLSKHKKNVLNWLRLGLSLAIGIFLCIFVMLALGVPKDPNDVNTKLANRYTQFIQSPWILPIIALSLLFVVFLNNTAPIVPKVEKRGRSDSNSSSSSDPDRRRQSITAHQPSHVNSEHRNGKLAPDMSHAEDEKISSAPEQQHQHQHQHQHQVV